MKKKFIKRISPTKLNLWDKFKSGERKLASFDLEITARCNNNCRHCYINLSADDKVAEGKELNFKQIKDIAGQAVDLGALWCLITGGEPLLRKDFFDIYIYLKKKGLLVSVFTNATLVTKKHVDLFKKYPPDDIEVTVYGVTQAIYDKVTRMPGSFSAFTNGVKLLLNNGIKVRFKAMVLRSNVNRLPQIARFCRARTKDYFRFDPFLRLRLDGNLQRNKDIQSERLSPQEIISIEQQDSERFQEMEINCNKLIVSESEHLGGSHLFRCGAGNKRCYISYDGYFRLCPSLWHPDCMYDLKKAKLKEAWDKFALEVRDMRSNKEEFLKKCGKCRIINLCMGCPAHSYLETGELDSPVEYFCKVAHARASLLNYGIPLN